MRIAIVLPPGFVFSKHRPNSIETVVRALNEHGNKQDDITVFCTKGAESHGDLSVVELENHISRSKYVNSVTEALKSFKPDLIECHQNVIIGSHIAQKLPTIPTIVYRHNFTKKPKNLFDRFRLWLRHKPIRGFVLVSEAVRKETVKIYSDLKNRSFAIPNPIDANDWAGDPNKKENTIFFSGRAAPEKGLEPLVDALLKVLGLHKNWKCVLILGDFETHKDWSQAQIDKLAPLGNQATILKSQPLGVVKAEISKASIAVIPSIWNEPFGLVALEAHAAGCAVISSGTGGLKEASGDHAIYLPKVDAEHIAEAIETIIINDEIRKRLAISGQSFVSENHNINLRQKQLQEIRSNFLKS